MLGEWTQWFEIIRDAPSEVASVSDSCQEASIQKLPQIRWVKAWAPWSQAGQLVSAHWNIPFFLLLMIGMYMLSVMGVIESHFSSIAMANLYSMWRRRQASPPYYSLLQYCLSDWLHGWRRPLPALIRRTCLRRHKDPESKYVCVRGNIWKYYCCYGYVFRCTCLSFQSVTLRPGASKNVSNVVHAWIDDSRVLFKECHIFWNLLRVTIKIIDWQR